MADKVKTMTNILKNKFFISLLASTLVSMALLSTAYAAEITVTTYNADGDTISSNSAVLKGVADVTEHMADVWFEYGTSAFLGQSTPKNVIGLNFTLTTFDAVINGLTANTTYYFQAVGRNIDTNLEVRGSILPFTTNATATTQGNNSGQNSNSNYTSGAPEVTTNYIIVDSLDSNSVILDAYVKSNGSNTVAWFTYWSCETNDISNQKTEKWRVSVTDYQTDFRQKITGLMPDTCYYFRGEAENDNGAASGNDRVFRTKATSNGLSFSQPVVLTSPAMFVRENSALLNGSVVPGNTETSVWFEWSENPEMTVGLNRSAGQSAGSGDGEVYAAYSLAYLILNKTYYFRVVAQNAYGTTRGTVKPFTTVKTAVTTSVIPTANAATPSVSQKSVMALAMEVEFDNTNPRAGSKAIYGLNYKNISGSVLKDAVLKITLPNEVGYMNSSFANVIQDGNILTMKLGDIAPDASGMVSIKMKMTDLARAQNLKFNAEISYSINGKTGSQNLASSLQISEYSLAASVLETLGSIFTNLFVDFILGLMIGAGAYHYYVINKKGKDDAEDPLK
ncbi:MAG: hypothetical protein Q7S81_00740 [bacterium]|nr:hypothetical protein [bacterium]